MTNTARLPELDRYTMSARGGCQCKLPGSELKELLNAVSQSCKSVAGRASYQPEDCAVLGPISDRLMMTTDMNALVGVNLFDAGRIAALHAMSDVYASGGQPKWALVTLIIDSKQPRSHAQSVLAGVFDACKTEHVEVVGGHTILGTEAMVGLSVIGVCSGDDILRKRGAQIGDRILISKPLGVGLVLRGYKLGLLTEQDLNSAVAIMTTSNAAASRAAKCYATAATDITGFGLLGHLVEMLDETAGAEISLSSVPVLSVTGALPRGVSETVWIRNNYDYVTTDRSVKGVIEPYRLSALLDPQTNGGLLVTADEDGANELTKSGFVSIGKVTADESISIR